MKKKTLCGVLATAMLFGVCPVTALAEEKHDYDDLTVLTESLDFRNAKNDIADEELGYEWDASSQTLTLDNFRVSVPTGKLEEEALIYLPDESTIDIDSDENVIETLSYHCDAIYCEGELWFEGDGELEIYTDSMGASAIYAIRGPVIFDDEVEITVKSDGYMIYVKDAKGDDPIISFRDEAKLIFPEEDAHDRSILVTHKSSVDPTSNWLDFAEVEDDWEDDYVNLVAKDTVKVDKDEKDDKDETPVDPPAAEAPSAGEEPAKQSEYQITIGNAAIKKDGYVTYISDAKPYLSHGYTMLPLRALLNVTGTDVEVAWDAATKTVTVSKTDDTQYGRLVYIVIGEEEIITGDSKLSVSTPAELNEGRAFVSLRDWMNILSALDMPASDLSWDAKTKTVTFLK